MNVATVCGPNLVKLGTHPLNIHFGPSRAKFSLTICMIGFVSDDFMICVLSTSTGLQRVVATSPARMEEVK